MNAMDELLERYKMDKDSRGGERLGKETREVQDRHDISRIV